MSIDQNEPTAGIAVVLDSRVVAARLIRHNACAASKPGVVPPTAQQMPDTTRHQAQAMSA